MSSSLSSLTVGLSKVTPKWAAGALVKKAAARPLGADELQRVARLASLKVDTDKQDEALQALGDMLGFVQHVQQVDVRDVEPMRSPVQDKAMTFSIAPSAEQAGDHQAGDRTGADVVFAASKLRLGSFLAVPKKA